MPVYAVLLLVAFIITLLAIKWIRNSKAVDRFATDLTEEKDFSIPKTSDVIKKIGKAETGLGERAKEQKEAAEKLEKESDSIEEYLDSKAVKHKDDIMLNDREVELTDVKTEKEG